MNIVTSVGYGDTFAVTDTERVLTMIMILVGDALIAIGFGILVSLAMSSEDDDNINSFLTQTFSKQSSPKKSPYDRTSQREVTCSTTCRSSAVPSCKKYISLPSSP